MNKHRFLQKIIAKLHNKRQNKRPLMCSRRHRDHKREIWWLPFGTGAKTYLNGVCKVKLTPEIPCPCNQTAIKRSVSTRCCKLRRLWWKNCFRWRLAQQRDMASRKVPGMTGQNDGCGIYQTRGVRNTMIRMVGV